jgi:hypothetical protein
MVLFILLFSISKAQTGYFLNPDTGEREVIFLVITPLGTDAQYRNDYSVKEYKPIIIKGEPIKLKKAKAVLPNNEKITIIFPTDKEYAKFIYADGKVKQFRDASMYVHKKDNQLAQIAVQFYLENDNVKYRIFYKPLDKKTEQQLEVVETAYREKGTYYKIIMPDGAFATLEEYTEQETYEYKLLLTEANGSKIVFSKEE